MNRRLFRHALAAIAGLAIATGAGAQQRPLSPHIGYVYPAGGQRGTTVDATIGGQALNAASEAYVSGNGVHVTIGQYSRPLTQREATLLRDKLDVARKKLEADGTLLGGRRRVATVLQVAREAGVTDKELQALEDFRKARTDPKRQLNPQIQEKVTLQIAIDANAAPGVREMRVMTALGLSNPIVFEVGAYPERQETEPNDQTPDACIGDTLPVVVNGQILPGDVDRFRFTARKGARLVASAAARELIPYLADAVPGWFQPVVTITDAAGKELACADHFRFSQDPVAACVIPADGEYTLEIHDSIYRGREDFVYRLTLGELPLVTSVFPLGGREGSTASVRVAGWNLPGSQFAVDTQAMGPGTRMVGLPQGDHPAVAIPFQVGGLPECSELEPNDTGTRAQSVTLPIMANGRIGTPGDVDVYRFQGRAGQAVVAETTARRLGSPVDTAIELRDASGRSIASNDDFEDKGAGLLTHQADSRIEAKLPRSGIYCLLVRDAEGHGGPEYAYRLRISAPAPDFELRVTPSSVSGRASTSVPITVYALRRDGFSGPITLALPDSAAGFGLSGARIGAGQDSVRLTLTMPATRRAEPVALQMEGRANIDGRDVRRQAVPAEDMMQAFAYRHLVPARQWLVAVQARGPLLPALAIDANAPVRIPAGGSGRAVISAPRWITPAQIQLALSDAPDGLTIDKVTADPNGLALTVRADAKKLKAGLQGNLIVDAYREVTIQAAATSAKPTKRRVAWFTLPAIPFEITPP